MIGWVLKARSGRRGDTDMRRCAKSAKSAKRESSAKNTRQENKP